MLYVLFSVISEFATISSETGSSRYPEPAATVASSLGLTNLNVFGLVPVDCFLNGSFYNKLAMKTATPLVAVLVLWLYPLYLYLKGKDRSTAVHRAARFSLLGMELICPSTTSTIFRTFVCVRFGDDFFLRANLMIPCDKSLSVRRWWKFYAGLMIAVYPLGVPLMLFCLMYPNRAEIKRILSALKEHDAKSGSLTPVAELRNPSGQRHRPSVANLSINLIWLLPKIKKFRPSCWYMSVLLLSIRLAQTSLMIIFQDQKTQALLASIIAMVSACVHRELDPYRRQSDNTTALVAQWLIYVWMVALLARLIRVLGDAPAFLVGFALAGATFFAIAHALGSAQQDLNAEREYRQSRGVEMAHVSSQQDLGAEHEHRQSGEVEMAEVSSWTEDPSTHEADEEEAPSAASTLSSDSGHEAGSGITSVTLSLVVR